MSNVKELNINSTTYDIIGKGVVDQNNTSNAIKTWSGTRAQYNAITTKDSNTLYNITDDATTQLSAHNLFDFKWADHELNDQSWLRADTYSWQDGTVYSNAYQHLVDDWNNYWTGKDPTNPSDWENETIGSYLITYITASDGHKIVYTDQETIIQNIYTESGVAWYYILDKANQRFKLPRTKYSFTGLRDAVGKYVPESLPNIRGELSSTGQFTIGDKTNNGALSWKSGETTKYQNEASSTATRINGIELNANDSSSTYQDNAPVQQRATQMYLYFYVGQFSQSATEQTAGLNAELFNGKVDLNLNNMNPSAASKQIIVGWGMPDYDSGVSISNGYTAPVNGVIIASFNWSNSNWSASIDGYPFVTSNNSSGSGQQSSGFCIAPKNSVFTTNASGTFMFFPLKGVQNA